MLEEQPPLLPFPPPRPLPQQPEAPPLERKDVPSHGGRENNAVAGRIAGVATRQPKHPKPFAFALAHGEGGASIWHGCLLSCRTIIPVKKSGDDIVIAGQNPIPTTEYIPADNLDTDLRFQTHLGWYGNVYGYWEADDAGYVTLFEIRGPSEPDGIDISTLNPDLTRETPAGKYYVLIGSVAEDMPVVQNISGDIPWFVTILRGQGNGSSSSSVVSSASISFPSISSGSYPGIVAPSAGSGSSKDSAVVPTPDGYRKWYATEAAGVIFFDFFEREAPYGKSVHDIDPIVMFCMERGTIRAHVSPERGRATASVHGGQVAVTARHFPWPRTQRVQIMLVGTRRGFRDVRLEHATYEDMVDNECRLNPRMTREEIILHLATHGISR